MKAWGGSSCARSLPVPEAPHPPLVEWKTFVYGEMVLGQASGAHMLKNSTSGAKVMGLIIPAA